MPNYNEFLNIIKQVAADAVNAEKPVNICFGKVINDSPLQILVDQKMILGSSQLVLSRNVTDFTTMVTVQWESESSLTTHNHTVKGNDSDGDIIDFTSGLTDLAHTHNVKGMKELTIHNHLKKDEEVILLRMQGGQKYTVLDRIGGG